MRSNTLLYYCAFLCTAADTPSGLTAEQLPQEPGSFRVSWTPPASSANLTGYRIYYSGANDSGSVDVGSSTTEVTIGNRKPGVTYSITIVALSSHLPSPVVGAVNVTLGENSVFEDICVLYRSYCTHIWTYTTVKLPYKKLMHINRQH